MEQNITKIQDIVSRLPKEAKKVFDRFFSVHVYDSQIIIPEILEKRLIKKFDNLHHLRVQKIVRVDNIITNESALFNSLRAERPMQVSKEDVDFEEKDDFCDPLNLTPFDISGRIAGKHCITAANLMRYDIYHDLIVFKEHNPLKFTHDKIEDAINLGLRWFLETNKRDKDAIYPFLMWNCLWKSGASIIHGHMQVILTKNRHYPSIGLLRTLSLDYKKRYKKDYFDDLFLVHKSLEIGFEHKGVKIMQYLSPKKEKEIMIIGKSVDPHFVEAIYKSLKCFRDELGVNSFNLGLILPPINKSWKNFPVIARIVDRGSLNTRTADIGTMELYAGSNVVASDPFKLSKIIKNSFKK